MLITLSNGLLDAAPGYKRIDNHYCEAWPRITVAGMNVSDSAALWREIDFLDGVITLNGVLSANSGFMFPNSATMLKLSLRCTTTSAHPVANTTAVITMHGSLDGVNFWESMVDSILDLTTYTLDTTLRISNPIVLIPVHSFSKIFAQFSIQGGPSTAISQIRLLGYYD